MLARTWDAKEKSATIKVRKSWRNSSSKWPVSSTARMPSPRGPNSHVPSPHLARPPLTAAGLAVVRPRVPDTIRRLTSCVAGSLFPTWDRGWGRTWKCLATRTRWWSRDSSSRPAPVPAHPGSNPSASRLANPPVCSTPLITGSSYTGFIEITPPPPISADGHL